MKPNVHTARLMAEIAHAGQLYTTGQPYTVHLKNARNVLHRFGTNDPVMTAAAWLHDAIEDTRISYNDIKHEQGEEVAELVYAVTNELGRDRKEKAVKTYPKTRAAGHLAVRLKLSDRISNIEAGLASPNTKFGMYRDEYVVFREALWTAGENEDMWNHLDVLMRSPQQQELVVNVDG